MCQEQRPIDVMHKGQSSTMDPTGQTPLGEDLTFRVTRPSSWRLFLWVLYLWCFYYACYVSTAWLYGSWIFTPTGEEKALGAGSGAFQIKLTGNLWGFYAPPNQTPANFLKVVWRLSLQCSWWQLPCGSWGMNRWRCDETPVFLCLCVNLFACLCVCGCVRP